MKFEEVKQAAQVFNRINSIRSFVTKERFAAVAQTRFGTTSNSDWCRDHWKNEKCYRFKL